MGDRYAVLRPRAEDEGPSYSVTATQIILTDREPVRTGLVDRDGNDLVRLPEPIGFLAWAHDKGP